MKHIYSFRKVVRIAKRDARNWRWTLWPFLKDNSKARVPREGQTETPAYWEELFQLGENLIAPIVEVWKEIDTKLKPEYCDAKKDDDRADKELEKLTIEKESSFKEYKQAKEKLNEFNPPALDKNWEFVLLIIIGVSELFINRLSFQLFGESELFTNIFSVGIGVVIPLLAFWFGYLLRQNVKSTTEKALLFVIPLGALAVMYVISVLRTAVFEGTGIVRTLKLDLSDTQLTILFYIINIVFFIGATVISYFASHPQGEIYKQAKKIFKTALKEFKLDEEEVKNAANRCEKTESRLEKITHKRAKIHQKLLAEAMSIKESAEWLMKSYKSMNLRHRPDFPDCFKLQHNAPEIPDSLQYLDWNCEEKEKTETVKEA
ncbi:MAG: hypothetical protein IPH11_15575 [Ignavibacteriales bacterium]|nr:hypothetical protein [Ignavibacteriales bacterium]